GWKRVDGYAGLEPARQLDYRSPVALQSAGATWASAVAATQIEQVGQAEREPNWIRLHDPRPRAWLVSRAIPSTNPAADINRVNLDDEALIDASSEPLESIPPAKSSVEVLRDRPGCFAAMTDCSAEQLLVVSQLFHTGWKATIDGQTAAVLRANGDFLGLRV